MEWLAGYLAVALVATVLWCVNRYWMVQFVKGVFVVGLVWLVAGCVTASPPKVTGLVDDTDRATALVCKTGKDRPDLDQHFADEAASVGVDVCYRPLPEKYASDDPAFLFARTVPECDYVLDYRLPTGYGLGCVLVACQAAFTYAQRHRPDAVIEVNWGLPHFVKHELYHALGCGHGEHSSEDCAAQIGYMKALLRERARAC